MAMVFDFDSDPGWDLDDFHPMLRGVATTVILII